jgi:hypothetical protein
MRFLTASVTTAACRRGANAERGAADTVEPILAHRDRGRRQLADLVSLHRGRVDPLLGGEDMRAQARQRSGQCSTTSSTRSSGSGGRFLPACPGWPPRSRPEPGRRGRGSADGGSCEGGSDELRELRLSRCSSSLTRASSRRFASSSSPIRISSETAVSRSVEDRLRLGPLHPTQLRRDTTGPCVGAERLLFPFSVYETHEVL